MREQVANGRSRRSGGLVEIDGLAIDSRQDRKRSRELRDGRPAEDSIGVAVLGEHAARADERSGSVLGVPAFDRAQGCIEVGRHGPGC